MNVAMILAGGVGTRMGADRPKQFVRVHGKPVIAHTLELFERSPRIDAVEVVLVRGWEEELRSVLSEFGLRKVRWVVEGGPTFMRSVYEGLKGLRGVLAADDVVMVHMSVAPFIGDDIIEDAIRICEEKGNSISENPCLLCMGTRDNDEYSTRSVLRETITGLNTPQTFRFGDLLDDYDRAEEGGYLDELEPHTTSLLYRHGKRLYFSKGSQMNVKITTRDDLELLEAYCIMRERREAAGCASSS